ncbi:MAG: hypothetical protein ACYTFY_01340 [Planctomycetota bacterium]|jgi:hypothetical protein
MTVIRLKNKKIISNLLFIFSLMTSVFITTSIARAVDEEVILKEMQFVEKIAAYGYYNLAKKARDNAKALPGLTEKQKTFLDLVQSRIAVSEIKKEKDLKKREAKLNSTIAYLTKVAGDLPKGSQLLLQAKSKIVLTYFDTADVLMEDADSLELKIKINPKNKELVKERAALLKLAQTSYEKGSLLVGKLKNELLDMFNFLAEKYTGEDNKALKDKYYKMLEMSFSQQVQFEHDVASYYVNFARSYPRGSKQRQKVYEEAYWFTADMEEFHKQYIPEDNLSAMIFIKLAGLVDQPVVESSSAGKTSLNVITTAAGVPAPVELLTNTFKEKIIGKNKKKTAKVGQEVRVNSLFHFAEGWYLMAKGAHQQYKRAKKPEDKAAWDKHVDACISGCKKVLSETKKGKYSIVGEVSNSIKKKAALKINLPLAIFEAERAHDKNDKGSLPGKLSKAKGLCSQLLLSKDFEIADAAKEQLAVINAYLKAWVPDYDPSKLTAGEAMAQGDNFYEDYVEAKSRGVADKNLVETLENMRNKFLAAKSLLADDNSIGPSMRVDYTAKCWYQIGVSSLLLEDFYMSYIANQHLLQVFRGKRYSASRYPEVDKYRNFAARNVVAAAFRQRKETGTTFDRKLYAESLIWRITYEVSKDPDKVKDFYYVVGEQYSKIGLYREGYTWFSKTPPESKLIRLSYLTRGNTALKLSKKLIKDAVYADKRIDKLTRTLPKLTDVKKKEVEEIIKEFQQSSKDKREEAKEWLDRAEKNAGQFLSKIKEFETKYKGKIPPEHKKIYDQEVDNKYAAFLLYMQIKASEKNHAAVRKSAEMLRKQKIPESAKQEVLVKADWLEMVANIDAVDNSKAPVDEVLKWLQEGKKIAARIDKNAEKGDPLAMQSKMLMGSRWLALASRVDDSMPEKASLYRRYAGDMFREVKEVVKRDVRFAIMVGRIFTDEKMYKDAEEIYDLGLETWDKEEKTPSLIAKAEFAESIKDIKPIVMARTSDSKKAEKMQKLHDELFSFIYGERPDFYAAQAKIKEIKAYAKEIAVGMMKKSPTDEIITKLLGALEYRAFILTIKRNLVLAKVSLEKWQEALDLLDVLLSHFKYDASFKILKGDVYYAMAESKKTYAEAKEKLDFVSDLCKTLTVRKKIKVNKKRVPNKEKLPRFSRLWWEAYGLYYQVQALEIVLKKDSAKAPKTMNNIKLWQSNIKKEGPRKPTEEFMRRTQLAYDALDNAGFSQLAVKDDRIKALEAEANKRLDAMRKKEEEKLIMRFQKPVAQAVVSSKSTSAAEKTKAKKLADEFIPQILEAMEHEDATKWFMTEMQNNLDKLEKAGLYKKQ